VERDPSPIVIALVKDLFFAVKLGQETRRAGFTPRVVKTMAEFVSGMGDLAPVLGIIDLGGGVDWDAFRALAANDQTSAIPVIAFGPHKDVEALQAAKAAGITRVMSNSIFHAQAAAMIRRYASTGDDGGE
jgi:CheY-like chemotaxis protein